MVELHQLPGAWGVSSVSPFCVKLEAFLRMAGVPFENRFGDPRKAPRGKVPWIVDDGEVIADSQRAIVHLTTRHQLKLDERLSQSERTLGHALRRMLEEGTYFGMVWLRWGEPSGWAAYRPVLVGMAPPVIGSALMGLIRRQMLGQLRAQGTGRYSEHEKHELVIRDFAALAQALGDKPFLFGDEPTSFDATAYAFVASLLGFPVSSPARDFAEKCENLVAYKNRITARYFA